MKKCKLLIKGSKWELEILPKDKYLLLHGSDSDAITKSDKKVIHFIKEEFCEKTCIHEIFHAYVSECHLQSTVSLSNLDFEEIIAELLEEYIDDIRDQAKWVYKRLNPVSKRRKK